MVVAEAESRVQLVLGPARSGKSRWAEHLAACSARSVLYVATSPPRPADPNWQQRLERHRARRPVAWRTRELANPHSLLPTLHDCTSGELALVDSLGAWVASALSLETASWQALCSQLVLGIGCLSCGLIIVSEQTGWGVVPPTAVGGLFRDRLGMVERQLVAVATTTWLVVAGRAIDISACSRPVPGE